jgi:hypothetical protein
MPFGSYSNQSTDSRVADLLAFSTAQVQQWLKTQDAVAAGAYQGYTTKVITMRVAALSSTAASVRVDTQQVSTNSSGSTTSYRSGLVELVKVGSEWKVNGFYWDKK